MWMKWQEKEEAHGSQDNVVRAVLFVTILIVTVVIGARSSSCYIQDILKWGLKKIWISSQTSSMPLGCCLRAADMSFLSDTNFDTHSSSSCIESCTFCRTQCTPALSGTCPVLKANKNLCLDDLSANLFQSLNAVKGPTYQQQQIPLALKAGADMVCLLYS